MFKKYYKKPVKLPKDLYDKYETYRYLSRYQLDEYGWLGEDKDHSLEFTSLYYSATRLEGNPIPKCQDESGMFHRHPSKIGRSLEDLKERTTISRDMFNGLMHYVWSAKRIDLCNDFIKYAHKHFFKMGNYITTPHPGSHDTVMEFFSQICKKYVPKFLTKYLDKFAWWLSKYEGITRVYMSPGLYFTYRGVRASLQRKRFNFWIHIPDFYVKGQVGFRANLTALHIAIRGELKGYLSQYELNIMKDLADRHPSNALFQSIYHKYLDGDQTKAKEILRREDLFPSNRLPSSGDRSTYWLWSSSPSNTDWKPNLENNHIHSGVDLIFICYLIEC